MKRGHFSLWEFLSEKDFTTFGISGWRFVCPSLLAVMNRLREDLGSPITGNNWRYGGILNWRGVRTPAYSKYSVTSAHAWGRAFDFDVRGMTPVEVIRHIVLNRDRYPEIRFIEIDMAWTHIDVAQREENTDELRLWSPTRGYVDVDTYMKETENVAKNLNS